MLEYQEYTLTEASVSFTFDVFPISPAICEVIYTYVVSESAGDPVVSVFDGATQTFTFDYTADLDPLVNPLAEFKVYTVTVTGTAGLVIPESVSQTF